MFAQSTSRQPQLHAGQIHIILQVITHDTERRSNPYGAATLRRIQQFEINDSVLVFISYLGAAVSV